MTFMCNVYVLISWRIGHNNMKPFLVYFASYIQPTLVRYIVSVGFQLRNNKQRVKMFTGIWTWLIKCSNPIKPEGLFRKFDHAHIQTKFISLWTFIKIDVNYRYLYLLLRETNCSELLTYSCFCLFVFIMMQPLNDKRI